MTSEARPGDVRRPITSDVDAAPGHAARGGGSPSLGFACLWDEDPRVTWSGTSWQLRRALADATRVVDLGVQLGRPTRTALKLGHVRLRRGEPVSSWKHSAVTDRVVGRELRRAAQLRSPDVALQVQDLAVFDMPSFLYQDLSYGLLLSMLDAGSDVVELPPLSRSALERRHERQQEIYEQATGILAMSRWFADLLLDAGIPAAKVHVVHPGANVPTDTTEARDAPRGPNRPPGDPPVLLFVGYNFHRKGGPAVIRALERLRRDHDPQTQLVVAGPTSWPLEGEPPEGVSFLGRQQPGQVAALMRTCDVLVLPSRFEAFGIVFAEALAHGMPCVAHRAYAMPEIIEDGVTGALVRDPDDSEELASAVVRVLTDADLYERVWAQREASAAYWSWERAAREVVAAVSTL